MEETETRSVGSAEGQRPPDFSVHQLVLFRAVARYGGYTRAAEALDLSQPAVSQQVKTLERMLGLPLFVRSGRGIALTAVGEELLRHAEHVLALLADTDQIVAAIDGLRRGSVTIGTSADAGTSVVPPLLGDFHARYPGIHITVVVAARHLIEEQLLRHELDVAVLSRVERPEPFVVESLLPYELVMVAAPEHHLARRARVLPDDLAGETFLLLEPGSDIRRDAARYFSRRGVPLGVPIELGSIDAIKEAVVAGLGIAVLPWESVVLEVADGVAVILGVLPRQYWWSLIHVRNRRLSRAAVALRQTLLDRRSAPAGSLR